MCGPFFKLLCSWVTSFELLCDCYLFEPEPVLHQSACRKGIRIFTSRREYQPCWEQQRNFLRLWWVFQSQPNRDRLQLLCCHLVFDSPSIVFDDNPPAPLQSLEEISISNTFYDDKQSDFTTLMYGIYFHVAIHSWALLWSLTDAGSSL